MEEKKEEQFKLGAIATQTEPVIVDTSKKEDEEGRTMKTEEALTKLLNDVSKLMKLLD